MGPQFVWWLEPPMVTGSMNSKQERKHAMHWKGCIQHPLSDSSLLQTRIRSLKLTSRQHDSNPLSVRTLRACRCIVRTCHPNYANYTTHALKPKQKTSKPKKKTVGIISYSVGFLPRRQGRSTFPFLTFHIEVR